MQFSSLVLAGASQPFADLWGTNRAHRFGHLGNRISVDKVRCSTGGNPRKSGQIGRNDRAPAGYAIPQKKKNAKGPEPTDHKGSVVEIILELKPERAASLPNISFLHHDRSDVL